MVYLLQIVIFYSYIKLPEGIVYTYGDKSDSQRGSELVDLGMLNAHWRRNQHGEIWPCAKNEKIFGWGDIA